jgi:hypothetical protein
MAPREEAAKLIPGENPDWKDLSLEWEGDPGRNLVPEPFYDLSAGLLKERLVQLKATFPAHA